MREIITRQERGKVMAITIHLGDCKNDCLICEHKYHDGQEVCDTCGKDFTSNTEWRIG
jgi:hypothetical protein